MHAIESSRKRILNLENQVKGSKKRAWEFLADLTKQKIEKIDSTLDRFSFYNKDIQRLSEQRDSMIADLSESHNEFIKSLSDRKIATVELLNSLVALVNEANTVNPRYSQFLKQTMTEPLMQKLQMTTNMPVPSIFREFSKRESENVVNQTISNQLKDVNIEPVKENKREIAKEPIQQTIRKDPSPRKVNVDSFMNSLKSEEDRSVLTEKPYPANKIYRDAFLEPLSPSSNYKKNKNSMTTPQFNRDVFDEYVTLKNAYPDSPQKPQNHVSRVQIAVPNLKNELPIKMDLSEPELPSPSKSSTPSYSVAPKEMSPEKSPGVLVNKPIVDLQDENDNNSDWDWPEEEVSLKDSQTAAPVLKKAKDSMLSDFDSVDYSSASKQKTVLGKTLGKQSALKKNSIDDFDDIFD